MAIDMALPAQWPLIPPARRTEPRLDGSLLPFIRSFLPGCFDLEGPLWLLHFTLVYSLFSLIVCLDRLGWVLDITCFLVYIGWLRV
jgi:hypothetical protein